MKKRNKNVLLFFVVILVIIAVGAVYWFGFRQQTFNLSTNTFASFSACQEGPWCSGCGGYSYNYLGQLCNNNPATPSALVNIYGYSLDTSILSWKPGACPGDQPYCTSCHMNQNYEIKNAYIPISYNGNQIGIMHSTTSQYTAADGTVCNPQPDTTAYINLVTNSVTETAPNASNIKIIKHDTQNYNTAYSWSEYQLNLGQDMFDVNITPLKVQYLTGENITLDIKVNNKFGQIYTQFCVNGAINTIFGLTSQKLCKGQMLLSKGITDISFTLPISAVPTQEIQLTPSFDIWLDNSQVSGVIFDYASQGQAWYACSGPPCDHAENAHAIKVTKATVLPGSSGLGQYIGSAALETQNVILNPRPVYINKTGACPSGYTASADNVYCIDSSLKDLGCVQLGCPTITGHNYQCGSSGICSETIYVQKKCTVNSDCPSGDTCDSSSGLCILTQIYNTIIQCSSASDCAKPCDGISISCTNNVCSYLGACSPTIVNNTQTITQTCVQLGCAESFTCNTARQVCERTITTTPNNSCCGYQLVNNQCSAISSCTSCPVNPLSLTSCLTLISSGNNTEITCYKFKTGLMEAQLSTDNSHCYGYSFTGSCGQDFTSAQACENAYNNLPFWQKLWQSYNLYIIGGIVILIIAGLIFILFRMNKKKRR